MAQKKGQPGVTFGLASLQLMCAMMIANGGNTVLAGFIAALAAATIGMACHQLAAQRKNDY